MKLNFEEISISSEYIKLDQFLKWSGVVESGVVAKALIQNEEVKVNGEIETRRGRKLYPSDRVELKDRAFIVVLGWFFEYTKYKFS